MANHKAGFVNIVGNPNVGKSTLMNSLVGERLSIITSKAQTTFRLSIPTRRVYSNPTTSCRNRCSSSPVRH